MLCPACCRCSINVPGIGGKGAGAKESGERECVPVIQGIPFPAASSRIPGADRAQGQGHGQKGLNPRRGQQSAEGAGKGRRGGGAAARVPAGAEAKGTER